MAMSKMNALLFAQESRGVLIDLKPWYNEAEDDKKEIDEYRDQAIAEIATNAMGFLPENNPLRKHLEKRVTSDTESGQDMA